MTVDWKDNIIGSLIMFGLLAVPVLGCFLAVAYNSPWWLLLLLPLFAFMEAGLFFIGIALFVVAYLNGW